MRGLARDVVILACGISAGIHAALVPDHLRESTAAGAGFAAAAVVLSLLVVRLSLRPGDRLSSVGAAAVLAGLLGSYALAVTTGLPVLHPDPEPVDGLALATKAIEAAGLLAAAALLRPTLSRPKGSTSWTRHAVAPSRSR